MKVKLNWIGTRKGRILIAVCIYRLVMISIKWFETAQKTYWPAQT